jgi:hypothetical protein
MFLVLLILKWENFIKFFSNEGLLNISLILRKLFLLFNLLDIHIFLLLAEVDNSELNKVFFR